MTQEREALDTDDQEAHDQEAVERRASASKEFPTNVTRSTQDLTTGGSEKDPNSHGQASTDHQHVHSSPADENFSQSSAAPTEALAAGLSSSEQFVVQPERALDSGEGSSG